MRGRKDVTTLVTGASAGIGKEIARLAAADSKRIVLVARRRPLLDELAAELVEANPDLLTSVVVCDLAEETSRRELLATLEKDRIVVDHLVNNAGFGDAGPFADYDADRHARMVDVNVAAVVHLTSALVHGMRDRGYGRVLNVASTAAFQPIPRFALYGATKSFVLDFSESLWRELRPAGVGVTCLCPGVTETEFFDAGRGYEETRLRRSGAMSASSVANAGYRAMLAGRRVVVPGLMNRLLRRMVPFVPRRLLLAVTERMMEPRRST
jgi:short-subunit dehydrogenase